MPCGNLGKKNSRNIWENKKIVSKSYSTPTNYIGSDIVHQVNKQKKTKDALIDFASTTTKWYTPINLNRPIILNSKRKPIRYHERKVGKQIMNVNNRSQLPVRTLLTSERQEHHIGDGKMVERNMRGNSTGLYIPVSEKEANTHTSQDDSLDSVAGSISISLE